MTESLLRHLGRFSAVAVILLLSSPALAQARIQIAPQIVEQLISPGGTLNEIISFTNAGRAPVEVTLQLSDFDVDEMGKAEVSPLGTGDVSLSPFLRVTPIKARVEPGQTARYRVVAKLPTDFDHLRVMLYFIAKPVDIPEGPTQTVIVPTIGVPVYVESTTSAPAQLELDDIVVSRSDSQEDMLRLTMLTKNVGERLIRPPVTIEVTSKDGSFYQVFEPNQGVAPVFPLHTRRWEFNLGPVPLGELDVLMTFPTSRRESFRSSYVVEAAKRDPEDLPGR